MADDDFELWLGRVGSDSPLLHRMAGAAKRAGRLQRSQASGRSRFTGARIGRGSGVGRVLSTRNAGGQYSRRVVVKTRIVKLGAKGMSAATAHLKYLQRDGTTREGERGTLYGAEKDVADGKAFLERGTGDRHQFRFIVSPEDGAEYADLKPLVRRLMQQAEHDLGTRLDWVAVDHFNTGHPHSHIMLRGKDDRSKDLIIARDYMTQGLRARAVELVDLDLGPRTEREIRRAQLQEIEQERFTGIDRRLVASVDTAGTVRAVHPDGVEQSLRAGRLQTLGRMGLAIEQPRGHWRLDGALEETLKRMSERGDIIRTMQRALTARLPQRSPVDHAIYDPADGKGGAIVGRVVTRGLSDEHADRRYLIIDGVEGRSHYVDVGVDADPVPTNGIVRVTPTPITAREVDRTVATIAAAHGGHYTVDIHLQHDRSATQAFAETHVRRLEAIRRADGSVERQPDGTWVIAPDHLERVQAYERSRAQRNPVLLETLSSRALDPMARHDGATWLDRELVATKPTELGRGFGVEVRSALAVRRQWLIEQQFAEVDGDIIRFRANMLSALQQRELRKIAGQLSTELGLTFNEARQGEAIEGIYRRAVPVGDAKFALIEKSKEFTLVPWRPVLERAVGKTVSGVQRVDGVSWTIGRSRGLGI